jgi:hypothetical protein
MATWLIIDGASVGLPAAADYYRDFPWEPSPLGNLTFDTARTTVMGDSNRSLDTVLDEMPKAGAGGIVMLVCHGNDDGFLLPMANGNANKSALPALQMVGRVISDEAQVARIRKMPRDTKVQEDAVQEAWKVFLNSLQPGMVPPGNTVIADEAEQRYEVITNNRAKALGFAASSNLRAFIVKLERVRSLKLARLELRACNIASNPAKNTMAAVRAFFNVGFLTAPMVGTFYMGPISPSVRPQPVHGAHTNHEVFGTAAPVGPLGRRSAYLDILESRVTRQTADEATRTFMREKTVKVRGVGFMDGMGKNSGPDFEIPKSRSDFTLTVHQFTIRDRQNNVLGHQYSANCTVFAAGRTRDWMKVQGFVKGWIMADSNYVNGPFRFAGLWTPTMPDMRYVLPNEREYLDFIKQEPAKTP